MEVKDHRRYVKMQEEVERIEKKELLPQVASDLATTGNEYLDKLIRILQTAVDKHELLAKDAATTGIGAVQDSMIRLKQFEYMYNKGLVDGLKIAMNVPAQMLEEAKGIPVGTTTH